VLLPGGEVDPEAGRLASTKQGESGEVVQEHSSSQQVRERLERKG